MFGKTPQPKPNAETPRELFIKAVITFEQEHKITIDELFEGFYDKNAQITVNPLVKEFLSIPAIHSYLTRDVSKLNWEKYHPKIEEKEDYTEVKLYKLMREFFGFRQDVTSNQFYLSGHSDGKTQFYDAIQAEFNNNMLYVTSNMDIYDARRYLNHYTYFPEFNDVDKYRSRRFILIPNRKDGHACSLVNVIDDTSRRVLATIFINSWSNKNYFKDMISRFNKSGYYSFHSLSEKKKAALHQELIDNHPVDLEQKRVFGDVANKTGYALNADEHPMLDSLFHDPRFERIVTINTGADENTYLSINREIPFIDASHHLQTRLDDRNCTLYSYNFIKAAADMLNNAEIAERIYQFAQALDKGDKQAENKLQRVFQDDLKSYLPCYYNEWNEVRSAEEIFQFHLQQRWEMDSELLDLTYPVMENERTLKPK